MQGIHLNQPHLADFDPFQSARTYHSSQVLDVIDLVGLSFNHLTGEILLVDKNLDETE